MSFREYLNEDQYTIETKKAHMVKLGKTASLLVKLGKKYSVKDIWLDRKDIFIKGFKNEKDVKSFKDEIKKEFTNINGFIISPSSNGWSLIIDMSKPAKMRTD